MYMLYLQIHIVRLHPWQFQMSLYIAVKPVMFLIYHLGPTAYKSASETAKDTAVSLTLCQLKIMIFFFF